MILLMNWPNSSERRCFIPEAREAFLSDEPNKGDEAAKADGLEGGWTVHRGGEMPAIGDRNVCVRYRNGIVSEPVAPHQRRWKSWSVDIGDSDWDIVAWKYSDPLK